MFVERVVRAGRVMKLRRNTNLVHHINRAPLKQVAIVVSPTLHINACIPLSCLIR